MCAVHSVCNFLVRSSSSGFWAHRINKKAYSTYHNIMRVTLTFILLLTSVQFSIERLAIAVHRVLMDGGGCIMRMDYIFHEDLTPQHHRVEFRRTSANGSEYVLSGRFRRAGTKRLGEYIRDACSQGLMSRYGPTYISSLGSLKEAWRSSGFCHPSICPPRLHYSL